MHRKEVAATWAMTFAAASGAVTRWAARRANLALPVGGFACFTVGAGMLHPVAGLFVAGASLLILEWRVSD